MRYHHCPSQFRTHHWADLWRNNIPDLKSVKSLAATSIFVAIDTEAWLGHDDQIHEGEAFEIGLCLLVAAEDLQKHDLEPPRSLQETYEQFSISSYCIRIKGRERRTTKYREFFWRGDLDSVLSIEADKVDEAIINILNTAQQTYLSSHGKLLTHTLVGFDLAAEFRILARQYPSTLGCFTSWVDIQELAKEASGLSHSPSLRDTLIGFGFRAGNRVDNPAVTPFNLTRHNAGNDAMRSTAVLVRLLFFLPQGSALVHIDLNSRKKRAHAREARQRDLIDLQHNLFRHRPRPVEKFPFRAKVDLPGACFPFRPDPGRLYEYFSSFRPTAVGSNVSQTFGGWVCFDSLHDLERFVKQAHGLEDVQGQGTWRVSSQYDPGLVPVTTAAELDHLEEQKLLAEVAEKRRIRWEKKMKEEEEVEEKEKTE